MRCHQFYDVPTILVSGLDQFRVQILLPLWTLHHFGEHLVPIADLFIIEATPLSRLALAPTDLAIYAAAISL